ncbi:2OG-Fe dioxygenase family protein [Nocardia sp. XZ_19_369]|uniref:2OG-Fe dioxygenase family protein n=1 Tax=Nocardia sp. XZ_19_369 TaxID=2769487 RepID=UPI00188FB189|nr:2OG-Fe dioxygenase family protein [Nocardia sp. XZ_19_369]
MMTADDFPLTERDLHVLRRTFRDYTELDHWLPGGEQYRRRAYQCFDLATARLAEDGPGALTAIDQPPPYVQSKQINPVAGDIERTFKLIPPEHPATEPTRQIATAVARLLAANGVLSAHSTPHCLVDAHYMRLIAPGHPAPEGKHRDGLIAGSAHLIQRTNVTGGVSALYDRYDPDRELCGFVLENPLDSYVFDDERVLHYATTITVTDPDAGAGLRDVLLIGFRKRE